jgi:hypothetical protein
MVRAIQSEIEELICTQLKTFGQQGSLSEADLRQCLKRFERIKQLARDLERAKGGDHAPWVDFN